MARQELVRSGRTSEDSVHFVPSVRALGRGTARKIRGLEGQRVESLEEAPGNLLQVSTQLLSFPQKIFSRVKIVLKEDAVVDVGAK